MRPRIGISISPTGIDCTSILPCDSETRKAGHEFALLIDDELRDFEAAILRKVQLTRGRLTMKKPSKERLLTIKELSTERGLNPSLVYWWVRERKFEVVRVGKKVLIPEKAFDAFIEFHREGGGEVA